MNVSEKINEGINLHLLGQFKAAESLYNEVLAENPDHPDAHNLLANLYHRTGANFQALYHANQAIAAARTAQFLNTRGMVFIGMARLSEAVADLRAALKLDPELAEAHSNLCIAYRQMKDCRKAISHGRQAVEMMPSLADAWVNLGAAQQDSGELEGALAAYERALQLAPDSLSAAANVARVKYMLQRFAEAVESFEAVYRMGGDGIDLRFAHAQSLQETGQSEAAALILEEGFKSGRDLSGLSGLVVQDAFVNALSKACNYFVGVINQPQRGVAIYERCLDALGSPSPSSAAPYWNNLGTVYFNWHHIPDAIRCYQKALEACPTLGWAYSNIGVCYSALGDSAKAIENFNSALKIQEDLPAALGWLLREKTSICDWQGFAEVRQRVKALRNTANTLPISPFAALSVFEDPQDLLYWAQLSAREMFSAVAACAAPPHPKRRSRRKKIRLGYYSFDFRNHPVAHLTSRLFELHDQKRFELYIYSYGPDDGSEVRRRIQSAAKHFVDLKDLSPADMAARIAEDDIDILVDLTGNTQHTRSAVLGLRPARIQAHWLGFIGTMGSPFYDYILADDFVAPPGVEGDFSEKILRLPGGMHVMDETRVIDSSGQTRAANGLPEDVVIFGCFCQSFKIQPETFSHWMEILRQVPRSVLWIASGPAGMEENLRKSAGEQGVDPARLIIAPRCGMEEYLTRFALIDLFLDTFPYTSGTVASDALLGGCPVLTLTGRSMVSRMAGSILQHADLADLVCSTSAAYVESAVRYGNSPGDLADLRCRVAAARHSASLFDLPAAVKGLEEAFASVIESQRN